MRRRGTDKPKRDERCSLYESRGLTWRDRLRWLVGGEKQSAPLCDPPRLVVVHGRVVGLRRQDGGVAHFADEPPSGQPDLWPDEWWQPVGELRPHWR